MAAVLGLVINLYKLQIVQGEKLTEKARNQQMVTLQPFIPRQIVVDRNNKILAFDRLVYTLYAHPKLVEKSDEQVAQKLAPILNTNAKELVKNFQSKRSVILLNSALPELAVNHVNLWWYCRSPIAISVIEALICLEKIPHSQVVN